MKNKRRLRPAVTLYRTRFAQEIVAEVALPPRPTGKVIVLAQGFPSIPSKRAVLEFLAGEGYAVVFPRYRGTWESGGFFLKQAPTEDLREVIRSLEQYGRFWCTFSQVWIPLRVQSIFVIASSFGGPAGAWMSELPIVKKVALLSPVLDWQAEGEGESFAELVRFAEDGFGMATRLRSMADWNQLRSDPHFYSFPANLPEVARKKIFLIHCHDDKIVPIEPAVEAVKTQKIMHAYFKPQGGHLGLSHITQLFFWHKIKKFFDTK